MKSMLLHGHIENGNVVLTEKVSLPDGVEVTVVLKPFEPSGAGTEPSAAGAWTAFPEMDEVMAGIERERAHDPRPAVEP